MSKEKFEMLSPSPELPPLVKCPCGTHAIEYQYGDCMYIVECASRECRKSTSITCSTRIGAVMRWNRNAPALGQRVI